MYKCLLCKEEYDGIGAETKYYKNHQQYFWDPFKFCSKKCHQKYDGYLDEDAQIKKLKKQALKPCHSRS